MEHGVIIMTIIVEEVLREDTFVCISGAAVLISSPAPTLFYRQTHGSKQIVL